MAFWHFGILNDFRHSFKPVRDHSFLVIDQNADDVCKMPALCVDIVNKR
jgi:hypothetical protein